MKNITCCFTGHRNVAQDDMHMLHQNTYAIIRTYIKAGYTHFVAGGADGFDTICAEMVVGLMGEFPHITLEIAKPYGNRATNPVADIFFEKAEVNYLTPLYSRATYLARNRYMVDKSDVCIFYMRKSSGGTVYTVNYAKKKGTLLHSIIDEATQPAKTAVNRTDENKKPTKPTRP